MDRSVFTYRVRRELSRRIRVSQARLKCATPDAYMDELSVLNHWSYLASSPSVPPEWIDCFTPVDVTAQWFCDSQKRQLAQLCSDSSLIPSMRFSVESGVRLCRLTLHTLGGLRRLQLIDGISIVSAYIDAPVRLNMLVSNSLKIAVASLVLAEDHKSKAPRRSVFA